MRFVCAIACFFLFLAQASAIRIHRSFRPTRYATGGSTSVIAPGFDMKPSVNFDETPAAQPRVRSFVGTVTKIEDGDTIFVTPLGGARKRVVLDRIDAPEYDQPFGVDAKKMLASLILNKKVEVKWTQRDSKGTTFGVVFVTTEKGIVDVNLSMILSGAAWYGGNADEIPAYPRAEVQARAARIGLWAAEDPIRPEDWRKRKSESKK